MAFNLELNLIKNKAKADDVDTNIVEAELTNDEFFIPNANIEFEIVGNNAFSKFKDNKKNNIIIKTNALGIAKALITSTKSESVQIKVSYNDGKNLISRFITFEFELDDNNQGLNDVYPIVIDASGENKNYLSRKTYYRLSSLLVSIPKFDGLKVGDTLKVYWVGSRTRYSSEIITVKSISEHRIVLPRYLFIDSIGSSSNIYFTQKDSNGKIYTSASLSLSIEGQELDLPAPRASTDLKSVSVYYPKMRNGQTLRVLIECPNDSYSSEVKTITKINTVVFYIPTSFLNKNKGKYCTVNYSVYDNSFPYLQFSNVFGMYL